MSNASNGRTLDNLDTPDLMREAERQTVLANAVMFSVSDDQRRELTLIREWLRPSPGGPLQ
jgi:hypothetical protein